jgi:hypothetical protein
MSEVPLEALEPKSGTVSPYLNLFTSMNDAIARLTGMPAPRTCHFVFVIHIRRTVSERRENNVRGGKDFYPHAKARVRS